MLFSSLAILAATAISGATAADSICDKYTKALLMDNTAKNQATLLTLVVNTVVIGNYTKPNVGIAVPGILAPGMVNGTAVNLLPYFSGGLASSNRGGSKGVAVNFLDDGGAVPLMNDMPSNGTTSSQYKLITHLYAYFGTLLGCTLQGTADFPAYTGHNSMYEVHKFMDLSLAEVTYFIMQVGLAAESFGVTAEDATAVGGALMKAFGYKCEPAEVVIPTQPAALQSICTGDDCPLSPNSTCSAYAGNGTGTEPATAVSSSSATGTGSGTGSSSSATGTGLAPISSGSANMMGFSMGAAVVAAGAFLL